MTNLTTGQKSILSLVGCETEADLWAAAEGQNEVGVALWAQIATAFWDYKRAEGQVTGALAKVTRDATKQMESMEQGFAAQTMWVLQAAEEAAKGQAAMEAAVTTIHSLNALRQAMAKA